MIVYLITNTYTGGRYVGVTVRSLQYRWREHLKRASEKANTKLARAIHKYGPLLFQVEVLAELDDHEALLAAEKVFISVFGTFSERNYNMTPGGETAPTLVKEIAMRGGATRSRIYRGAMHHRYGAKRSEEAKAKHKATIRRRLAKNDEFRALMSEVQKRLWSDPTVRARRIAALKGKPKPPRTEEHKRNISIGRKRALELKHAQQIEPVQ